MNYLIEVRQRSDGADVARLRWNGRDLVCTCRNGAGMAVARAACAAGAPDGPWMTIAPGDTAPRLQGRSLHALARLTISEGKGRPRVIAWREHPMPAEAAESRTATGRARGLLAP